MIRSNLRNHDCPLARAMGVIGDGWMLLTLWATLNDVTRFEEMLVRLGVARNILSDRLRRLVEAGLLTREPVSPGSTRYRYVPTASARELKPALDLMYRWGAENCPKGRCGRSVLKRTPAENALRHLRSPETGLHCRPTGILSPTPSAKGI